MNHVNSIPSPRRHEQGVVIVVVLIMLVLIMGVITAHSVLSLSEVRTAKASNNSITGFYSAEGGLNMRAEQVRALFQGYSRPTGTSPNASNPCTGSNTGSGDIRCITYSLNGRSVITYVQDVTKYDGSGNPETGVVEPGDTYVGLNYQQYAYNIVSVAKNANGATEATLKMVFQSRLVPLFQFAAFYNRDLEFHPGPPMTLNGRVHTNGNLYLNAGNTLTITGNTDAAGTVNRFGKDGRGCTGTVTMSGTTLPCNGFTSLSKSQLPTSVKAQQAQLSVPSMNDLNPDPNGSSNNELWGKADVRLVAKKTGSILQIIGGVSTLVPTFTVLVENRDGSTDYTATTALALCNASAQPAVQIRVNSMYDAREAQNDTVMDVDQKKMMDCIQNSGAFKDPSDNVLKVDDMSGGGLVWHLSFDDGNPATNGTSFYKTNYAVEVHNGDKLGTTSGTPDIAGLTVVSNQQMFVQGNYNSKDKKPASLLADAISILSSNSTSDVKSNAYTVATPTTVNAAFLSGIDDTVGGQYNGGLQNYTRFHENWANVAFNYSGSFVSLGTSLHNNGPQSRERYSPPDRNWNFETDFNNVAKLPPLSPRFVYLRQLLFSRNF